MTTYKQVVDMIKEGMKSNDEYNKRKKRVDEEIVGFLMDMIINSNEFVAMESIQFKQLTEIPISHDKFTEKFLEKFRVYIPQKSVGLVIENVINLCPCFEIKNEAGKDDVTEVVNMLFSTITGEVPYTMISINTDKLDCEFEE